MRETQIPNRGSASAVEIINKSISDIFIVGALLILLALKCCFYVNLPKGRYIPSIGSHYANKSARPCSHIHLGAHLLGLDIHPDGKTDRRWGFVSNLEIEIDTLKAFISIIILLRKYTP